MKYKQGFTIVELLIVIVVIAILAAISVVAYTGIQKRAENTQLLAAVDAYEKAIRMYMIDNGGRVPASPTVGNMNYPLFVCLGDNYPATSHFDEGRCADDFVGVDAGDGWQYYDADASDDINNSLNSYLSTLPNVAEREFTVSNTGVRIRGLLYQGYNNYSGDTAASIAYYIDGSQQCGRGHKQTAVLADGQEITLCQTIVR